MSQGCSDTTTVQAAGQGIHVWQQSQAAGPAAANEQAHAGLPSEVQAASSRTWKSTVACGTYALRLTKSMAVRNKSWMACRSKSAGWAGRQHSALAIASLTK